MKRTDYIREHYPERLRENKEHLCGTCWRGVLCNLLPITTKGEDCPYYAEDADAIKDK